MTENNKIPKETEEKILKKFDRELQEEGEAMIEDYSDDMMQWTKNDVLNKIKQTISLAFEECKKQTKEEVLKLIDKRLPYILCYGLKKNLSEKEIEQFKKIFWALLEEKNDRT